MKTVFPENGKEHLRPLKEEEEEEGEEEESTSQKEEKKKGKRTWFECDKSTEQFFPPTK